MDVRITAYNNTDRARVARPALWGRLLIRAKLYLAFSAISGLVIVSAIAATVWTRNTDAETFRNLSLLELAKRQSTVVELNLMTMSDAMRGYLLDPAHRAEVRRKLAADTELGHVVEELKVTLAELPSVLRLVTDLEIYDDRRLNEAEDHLVEIADEDIEAAKRLYRTDYLPMRQHEIGLVLDLRREVARVEEDVKAKAVRTHHKQIAVEASAIVIVSILSGLVGWICTRAISGQIRGLTAAMGKLVAGDTTSVIPSQDGEDEIGDMARAVEVFRADAVARRQGEAVLQRINLQLDAALNSMLQGMVVWGPDHRVQLVNARFFAMCRIPMGCIGPGMTVTEVINITVGHGLHPDDNPIEVADGITALLAAEHSAQFDIEMRPGLFVQIASEPMPNGGTVITFEDVTDKRRNEEQIAFMARHDALTGLCNRTRFQDHMEETIDRLADDQRIALFCLDLDRFKEVNDTFGHGVGDELLRLVAGRLRSSVRDRDAIARLGGDEFAIVSACATSDPAIAAALAARVVASISAPFDIQGHQIFIGTSVGVAVSEPGLSIADLLKRADVALYHAKKERGTFAFFELAMADDLQARRGMEADLRMAVQRGEFELHYQPFYNFAEERITGFEALVRWNSPSRGCVSPADFIALSEATGLIAPIGEWVLRTACAEAAGWPDHVSLAVNLSPVQFKDKRLVAMVRETLKATSLPARRLGLEITETALLQDTESVMAMLQGLHHLGVRVAMDDFGTGYSSLSYLHRFPFDKIKIDQSFVRDLLLEGTGQEGATSISQAHGATAKSATVIVHAMIGLGSNLGISTIAEGVETAQQFVHIRQEGCSEVQGYFISPPRPANEIATLRQILDTTLPAIARGPRRLAKAG